MTILVNVDGFISRFNPRDVTSADINDIWLLDAEGWVTECLAERFIMPTSASNLTASRLTYQKAWHLLRLRTLDPDDSTEMGESIDAEIKALNDGEKAMVHSGSQGVVPEYALEQQTDPEDEIWSNTMGYNPTFDEDEAARQIVDTDKINDVRFRRK